MNNSSEILKNLLILFRKLEIINYPTEILVALKTDSKKKKKRKVGNFEINEKSARVESDWSRCPENRA